MPMRMISCNDGSVIVYCRPHGAYQHGKDFDAASFKLKERLGLLKAEDYY